MPLPRPRLRQQRQQQPLPPPFPPLLPCAAPRASASAPPSLQAWRTGAAESFSLTICGSKQRLVRRSPRQAVCTRAEGHGKLTRHRPCQQNEADKTAGLQREPAAARRHAPLPARTAVRHQQQNEANKMGGLQTKPGRCMHPPLSSSSFSALRCSASSSRTSRFASSASSARPARHGSAIMMPFFQCRSGCVYAPRLSLRRACLQAARHAAMQGRGA